MFARPTLGWLLGRIWHVVSGEERRELIAEMRELTRKTNELIARHDAQYPRAQLATKPSARACRHDSFHCPICHAWGPRAGTGGAA